jgi:hypothetical protein
MKITTVSANELELREGNATGIAIGAILIIAALAIGLYLRRTNPIPVWIAPLVAAVGIGLILFSSSITVNANKATGQLRYQKKRLLGAQNTTYAIADVFRIETRKQWRLQNAPQTSGNQGPPMQEPVLVAQSVIVFKDGRELALDHQKTSSSMGVGSTVIMGGQGAETAMAAKVAQFLGVPFQEIMPPNMSGGINIIAGGGPSF